MCVAPIKGRRKWMAVMKRIEERWELSGVMRRRERRSGPMREERKEKKEGGEEGGEPDLFPLTRETPRTRPIFRRFPSLFHHFPTIWTDLSLPIII